MVLDLQLLSLAFSPPGGSHRRAVRRFFSLTARAVIDGAPSLSRQLSAAERSGTSCEFVEKNTPRNQPATRKTRAQSGFHASAASENIRHPHPPAACATVQGNEP